MAVLSDGRVAFAEGALPGDVIRPLGVESRKGVLRATRWDLVTPSPDRVPPRCPIVARCGGCDWMSLARAAQLRHKELILRSALERTGKIALSDTPIPVEPSGAPLGYRSRTRFHVAPDGEIGFFERRAHSLVRVPECAVCRPELNAALAELRKAPPSVWREFSEIELSGAEGAPVCALLRPRVAGGVSGSAKKALAKISASVRITIAGEEEGEADRFDLPFGVHLRAPPGVFTQVNWAVNRVLVETLVNGALARGVKRFCDAYSGAGNFSLPLLAQGMRGVSIEKDGRAVRAARRAAREQDLPGDGFVEGSVRDGLRALARKQERFDLVVLDPPRAGAAEALGPIVDLAPAHVAYVSCDPVTLARDLRTLGQARLVIDEIRGFDMFPETHHLETLVWLRAEGSTTPA